MENENKDSLKGTISFVWIYFVMPFVTLKVVSGIYRRLIIAQYFKADIDDFRNAIEPFNGQITLFLIGVIILIMFLVNIKKIDLKDIKGTLRRGENKFISYTMALIFVAFLSYFTVDGSITNASLVFNRIHNTGEIHREYSSVFFYDYDKLELVVGVRGFEAVKVDITEWEKVINNESITLVFSVGWLGIPHSPVLLSEVTCVVEQKEFSRDG